MAGGQERILRRRIKSVQSTRKITKAMELIAASQISRSQARIIANRPYRNGMRRIIVEAAHGDPAAAAKLLAMPEQRRHRRSSWSSTGDRGLSGAYNSSALRAGERLVRKLESEGTAAAALQRRQEGRRLLPFPRHRRRGEPSSASSDRPTFTDARRIAPRVAAPFIAGEAQQVLLVSTRFLSAAHPERRGGTTVAARGAGVSRRRAPKALKGYTEFEPEVEKLLDDPRAQGPRERDLLRAA